MSRRLWPEKASVFFRGTCYYGVDGFTGLSCEDCIYCKGVFSMNNNNDRIQRSNYILLGLVILMLLYGVIYRFMSGDDSLYIFGIPVIPGSNKEETTQEETTGSDAPADSSRALFQAIDEMLV